MEIYSRVISIYRFVQLYRKIERPANLVRCEINLDFCYELYDFSGYYFLQENADSRENSTSKGFEVSNIRRSLFKRRA